MKESIVFHKANILLMALQGIVINTYETQSTERKYAQTVIAVTKSDLN